MSDGVSKCINSENRILTKVTQSPLYKKYVLLAKMPLENVNFEETTIPKVGK